MSKLARKPISLANVKFELKSESVTIEGPLGSLTLPLHPSVTVNVSESKLFVSSELKNMVGLYSSLIRNIVHGVQHSFSETLIIKGVGYRVSLSGSKLDFNLGFSHPVVYELPDGINASLVSQTEIVLTGIDKQQVGQVAAEIVSLRPAKKDPYKEKGIKRKRDRIMKKVGKKVK